MSLIITLHVREGIVMASDSRITLTRTDRDTEGRNIVHSAVSQTDSVNKTFLTKEGIGISIFGAADINGVPISGFIESFIREELEGQSVDVSEAPAKIIDYFNKLAPGIDTHFHIAGYRSNEQQVWSAQVKSKKVTRLNATPHPGASWGGDSDVIYRILQPLAVLDANGNMVQKLPASPIPFQFFTLQDAIDFAHFAVNVTIDALRFQARPKSVGGPIDILVIKPDQSFWVNKKTLKAPSRQS